MLNFWPHYVREVWTRRVGACARVALFGAGEHSGWLIESVADLEGPEIVALFDDRADHIRELKGRPVVKPESASRYDFEAVVVSSDAAEEALFRRAKECFPDRPVVRLYEGLPPGPYDKHGELPAGICTLPGPAETINLETVLDVARSVGTKEKLIEAMGKLDPDPYIGKLTDGYRRGIKRFGSRWRYVDLWSLLYAYAALAKPKRYLEVGTRRGHSLAVVVAGCTAEGECELEVVSCDLWIENYADTDNPGPGFVIEQLKRLDYDRPVTFLSGSSHELLPQFLRDPRQQFDLVTVDGDHSRDGALADLNDVLGSIRLGGMLAFDDINHPQHPYLGEVFTAATSGRANFETFADPRNGTGIAAALRYR